MKKDLGPRSSNKTGSNSSLHTELTGVKLGQKHQVTVRLESSTLERVESLQEVDGTSFAETIRRLVRIGISEVNLP